MLKAAAKLGVLAFLPAVLCCPVAAAALPCGDAEPQRRAYFGDLHVHTRYSQDANWRMGTTLTGPEDAYRFARGARLSLPPFDPQGRSIRSLQLRRPLDFMAVTDHAEGLGPVRICEDPDYDGPGAWLCGSGVIKRAAAALAGRLLPLDGLCEPGDSACTAAELAVWQDTINAAEAHNEPCAFSAFVGFEWTGMDGVANMHRNVIFRSGSVIAEPLGREDVETPEALWDALDSACRDAVPGCDAITIPHNSNLSKGRMFSGTMTDGTPLDPVRAAQRLRYERLAEIVQHKGESECYGGPGATDELCGFEKLPYGNFLDKYLPLVGEAPANDSRYLREALREGLRLEETLDVNPFMPGFIGGTDSHNGTGGAVAEGSFGGHHGARHIDGRGSAPQLPDSVEYNPGGLAVLYAEQNTRDALYAAMQRREAYATSGPRIQLRFFGGWDYEGDLCERVDLVARGYAHGVPMGGVLPPRTSARAPQFVLAVSADPGPPGAPGGLLQRVQVVKSWVDESGASREAVFDVAGRADNGAGVNLATCRPEGPGHRKLCAVWEDPDFDPARNAFYYSRVLENPSCRWQQRICAANQVSCTDPGSLPGGLRGCCDDSVPRTIQERAWSSPIWYQAAP